MLQKEIQAESQSFEWVCQALSAMGEHCETSAICHCDICGKWLCGVHAEDEAWHRCALEPGDEGGEG
jgi:hypothetical protein